ncbi:MAG TPA: cytochrome c [Thermohalobaculum sp.]|nr:cytochrome c [Thermohalobaculum sp.]
MNVTKNFLKFVTAALFAAVVSDPMAAIAQDKPDGVDKAIGARQGFMQLVSFSAGPIFGMAKGDVAYDAGAAQKAADNLVTLYNYPYPDLFVAGSSKEDRPGKTRALPEIFANKAKFDQYFADLQAAVGVLAQEAGKGQPELAAAIGAAGKICGACHNDFRAKEF